MLGLSLRRTLRPVSRILVVGDDDNDIELKIELFNTRKIKVKQSYIRTECSSNIRYRYLSFLMSDMSFLSISNFQNLLKRFETYSLKLYSSEHRLV